MENVHFDHVHWVLLSEHVSSKLIVRTKSFEFFNKFVVTFRRKFLVLITTRHMLRQVEITFNSSFLPFNSTQYTLHNLIVVQILHLMIPDSKMNDFPNIVSLRNCRFS